MKTSIIIPDIFMINMMQLGKHKWLSHDPFIFSLSLRLSLSLSLSLSLIQIDVHG